MPPAASPSPFPRRTECLFSLALVGSLLAAACGHDTVGGPGDWRSETVTVDGVRTIRTLGGSVWPGPARLVEEVVISPATAGEAGLFGRVDNLAVGNGCIYVVDSLGPVVRVFDLDGRHLRDIGRRGDGPGEFNRPRAVAVHPLDGRIFVRDGRGGRINVYAPDGSFLERWPLSGTTSMGWHMRIRPDGVVLTPQVLDFNAPLEEWRTGIVGFGPQGAVGDTIPIPRYDFKDQWVTAVEEGSQGMDASPVPFSPSVVWAFGPDGSIASGVGTSYRFEVRRPDGTVLGIERRAEPVPVQPAERSWWEACTTAGFHEIQPGWAWNGPPIPTTKPLFNDLLLDASGRVWVRRPGPGVTFEDRFTDPYRNPNEAFLHPYWGELPTVDIFDLEGRYLGEVSLPKGIGWQPPMTARLYVEADLVVALVEEEDGTPTVRRYRLVVEGGR
jgi:hypothetical protein